MTVIIDSHTHFGKILEFDMPAKDLIKAMDLNGIDCAVISNIEGAEFDHDLSLIHKNGSGDQIKINKAVIEFSEKHPGRIFPLVWTMPHTGGVTSDFRRFVIENRNKIYGIKLHPFLNKTPVDSKAAEPYIRLAAELELPIAVHTASTNESDPIRVENVARKYPGIKLLLVHMGLFTDHKESIRLILEYPNIYGDTSWVKAEDTMRLIERGGIDKVMFGTDALVSGRDIYTDVEVKKYLYEWKEKLGPEDHDKLLSINAMKFFGITKIND